MTLAEILSNEELRRREFPVARDKVFLAHAGVCPLPHRVAEAMRAYLSECMQGDQEANLAALLRQTRGLAAQLLHAQPDEIAFVGPTSLALSFIAAGLSFRKHENALVYFDDYPANVYPWMALAERGVEVRFLNVRELGRIRPLDVLGQVDEHTRLVALASCHFVAGYRVELAALGQALHARNIHFCVDAIQTLGAFPTTVEHVDFLAADAHKWLLGPCAAGILFVRQALQPFLRPMVHGWNNIQCPNYTAQEKIVFHTGARRYEAGTHNIAGLAGLKAALELILELGVENIAAELRRKREWFVPALQAKGFTVLQAATAPENVSGITSIHRGAEDLSSWHQRLTRAGIITSLRADRAGNNYLRFSPHYYNTDEELYRVLELL